MKGIHNSLKYKIIRQQLPEILEKKLYNFLDKRKVKIYFNNDYSNDIKQLSGVS